MGEQIVDRDVANGGTVSSTGPLGFFSTRTFANSGIQRLIGSSSFKRPSSISINAATT
jgi:hypothetical protein